MPHVVYHGPPEGWCHGCYGEAKKAGRPVRKYGDGTYCAVCESRAREGLVHYSPSNGTEGEMWFDRCECCRYYAGPEVNADFIADGKPACAYGIADKVMRQVFADRDDACHWFDPADLSRHDAQGRLLAPAECLKFERREFRDGDVQVRPPPPDCEGQLTFDEIWSPRELSAADRFTAKTREKHEVSA